MLEAGTGLEKTAVVEGQPFVVVGIPAFNEEKTIAKIVLKAQEYAIGLWFVMMVLWI